MKRILTALILLSSLSVHASGILPASIERYVPKQPTPRIMSGTLVMTVGYLAVPYLTYTGLSTSFVGWVIVGTTLMEGLSRSWAPQAADELIELQKEMIKGDVKEVAEVKQPTVREAFNALESDAVAMRDLENALPDATHLERLVVGVQVMLTPVQN
ncbi:MAG: hypothetical protein K2P81_09830 [Bacteriovoracaceae bacterium]|nr:hypothetical protein [Bacteriovoracaceae bacterium]